LIEKKKNEEIDEIEEKKMDQKEDEYILLKTGTFDTLREETKFIFTISQKKTSNTKIERLLLCKTQGCRKNGKVIQIGKSKGYCELYFNQYEHEPTCLSQHDLFKTSKFRELLKGNLTPNELIKKFNQDSDQKLPNNEETRRKISQLKYNEKQKINNIESHINNIKDLKNWLENRSQANINSESFSSLNWDEAFISDYEIYQDNFFAFATTKNLIYNIVKQSIAGFTQINADGTYKLNSIGYPTIVFGTVDLHRKFHLSNFFNF